MLLLKLEITSKYQLEEMNFHMVWLQLPLRPCLSGKGLG